MQQVQLFMIMLGCRPLGRNTEQHDVFFGIAENIRELVPAMKAFWPEAKGNIHVDAWRTVSFVNGYQIKVLPKTEATTTAHNETSKLFFLNLGGYKPGEFDEFHYKMLVVAKDQAEAIRQAKQTSFYKHTGFKGAASHIDDKFGVDVDEIYQVQDILPDDVKQQYTLQLIQDASGVEDELNLGYFKLNTL